MTTTTSTAPTPPFRKGQRVRFLCKHGCQCRACHWITTVLLTVTKVEWNPGQCASDWLISVRAGRWWSGVRWKDMDASWFQAVKEGAPRA